MGALAEWKKLPTPRCNREDTRAAHQCLQWVTPPARKKEERGQGGCEGARSWPGGAGCIGRARVMARAMARADGKE